MQYPSHGLTGGLQLYDFARDPEVKLLAKAHFDWVCAATAVEYFRGSWAGSNIRDYGNIGPHSGAAGEFWHHFGDLAQPAKNPYRDFLRLITSAYRPPAAVVELARKDFPKPVEILASKPSYEDWFKGGEKEPTYFETTFIGHHSQLGSLPKSVVIKTDGARVCFQLEKTWLALHLIGATNLIQPSRGD